jgi:cell division protein FtsB
MGRNFGWHALLVLLAASIGAVLSIESWQHYSAQRRLAEAARAEMRAAEAERVRLMRQEARLESAAGREERARERGYRREGELPLEASGP